MIRDAAYAQFTEAFGTPSAGDEKVKGVGWRLWPGLDVYLMKENPPGGGHAIVYLPRLSGAPAVPDFATAVRATGERSGRAAGTFKFASMHERADTLRLKLETVEQIKQAVAYITQLRQTLIGAKPGRRG